jgi:MFS family permease
MCFMIMLDSNIVAVSLPSIARDLGAACSDIEWVVSAYVLTFAALLMPSGALADRYGRRRTALVGLSVSTLSSLLCGLAPDALILNMARTLQGIGAAGSAQFIVSRIISGDITGAVAHVAPTARSGLIEVTRGSFAAGFMTVLIVGGSVAALGALLTALLVSTLETAPARRPHAAASRLPEVMD